MGRLYNTFEFIGNIFIPKNKEKFHEVKENESGWEGHRLNFAIQESKTNSVFLEMYGGFSKSRPNKVFSFSKGTENEKGSKLEIPWEDRLKEESVDVVADFKRIVLDLTTDFELKDKLRQLRFEIMNLERKDVLTEEDKTKLKELKLEHKEKATKRYEFIHEYDAVVFAASVLEYYKDHKFRITGRVEYNHYNDKFYRKFKPELIEIVESDTKPQLRATMDIFFTKDSVDEADFKEEKKIYINGYVVDYDSNAKKDAFFPQQFILNAQKIDLENKDHVGRLDFLRSKFNVKGKGVYHLQWYVNIFRGADKVEFTYDDLTAQQKEAIEFGLNTVEDFEPKGGMLGANLEETRLVKPVLQEINKENDFREGALESSYEEDDLIYVASNNGRQSETKNESKEESNTTEKKKVDVDLDQLFG
jgi:hypothetical protein